MASRSVIAARYPIDPAGNQSPGQPAANPLEQRHPFTVGCHTFPP
jgi:hypothetical protein